MKYNILLLISMSTSIYTSAPHHVIKLSETQYVFMQEKGLTIQHIHDTIMSGEKHATSKQDVHIYFCPIHNLSVVFNDKTHDVVSVEPRINLRWLTSFLNARDNSNRRRRIATA